MKILDIIEARKNPEQNPKTSINRIVYDAVNAAKGAEVAGTTNLFVSFTGVDKLGINPKSKYDTPIGIYAYPGEYVVKTTGSHRSMRSLPFAGEQPHVNLFNAKGNIINVATISSSEVRNYYKRLSKLWAETSGQDWKKSVDEIEALTNEASTKAKFPEFPGGQLWYVTMRAAAYLFAPKWKTSVPVAWNKLFRSIGIDGAVDYTPSGGEGIIHTSEPTQAVFFAINSIDNVQRHNNLYSPSSGLLDIKKQRGAEKHQLISKTAANIRQLSDPEDILNYLEKNGFEHLKLVKDQSVRSFILKQFPFKIDYLPHPTAQDQKAALAADITSIEFIRNPIEQVFLDAYYALPEQTRSSSRNEMRILVNKFPKASEQMQLFIAQHDPSMIERYTQSTKHNLVPKTYPSVIKTVLKAYTDREERLPGWLVKQATAFKIPFTQRAHSAVAELRKEIVYLEQQHKATTQKIEDLKATALPAIQKIKSTNPDAVAIYQKAVDDELKKLNFQLEDIENRLFKTQQALRRAQADS